MTAFHHQAITILQQCREELEECTLTPLRIESYREEIVLECNIAVDLWNELKACESRIHELEFCTKSAKDMPNKMEYSKAAKELLVVKMKSKELSSQINKEINASSIMVKNTKRVKIEMDRLEDILRIAQLELLQSSESSDYNDGKNSSTPSLQAEVEKVPPQLVREQLITQNRIFTQSLEEVRSILHQEKEDHRELVADLQLEIKTIRDDLDAMANGTYLPALEFQSRLINRRQTLTFDANKQRDAIKNDIELLKERIYEESTVQDAKILFLQNEQLALEERLADVTNYNSTSMQDIEMTFSNLQQEQSNITVLLHGLAPRVAKEEEEEKTIAEKERNHLHELEAERAMDEREYFAALWIQLRWKAYCKRKAILSKKKCGTKKKK